MAVIPGDTYAERAVAGTLNSRLDSTLSHTLAASSGGRDLREWGSMTVNTDISGVLQAAIDDCFARNDSTPIIIPAVKGLGSVSDDVRESDAWLANVIIKPNVSITGQGWRSILKSNPGATTPVIGSAKDDNNRQFDPSRNRITNLAIYGNNLHGANCRGIELVSALSDGQWGYGSPAQQAGDKWNDTAPILSGLLVMGCKLEGVVLGRNMRGAWFDRSFVFRNVGTGVLLDCTDAQLSNLQIGCNGDGVITRSLANQFVNCKAWFSFGTNTDIWSVTHTGSGVGFIFGPGNAGSDGSLNQLTGCETQDNYGYGLLANNVESLIVTGHMTGGDGNGAICVKGSSSRFNTFKFSSVWGDRTQAASLVVLDGTGGAPSDNLFEFEDAEAGTWTSRLGGFVAISQVNGGITAGNSYRWVGAQGRQAPSVTLTAAGSYTPNARHGTHLLVMPAGNITINAPTNTLPGSELTFMIVQDSVGSRTVTWAAQFLGPSTGIPALNTAANGATTYKFLATGAVYRLISKT